MIVCVRCIWNVSGHFLFRRGSHLHHYPIYAYATIPKSKTFLARSISDQGYSTWIQKDEKFMGSLCWDLLATSARKRLCPPTMLFMAMVWGSSQVYLGRCKENAEWRTRHGLVWMLHVPSRQISGQAEVITSLCIWTRWPKGLHIRITSGELHKNRILTPCHRSIKSKYPKSIHIHICIYREKESLKPIPSDIIV